jgi:DoxX-like protein
MKTRLWAGRIIMGVTLLFLLMDAVMKVVKARPSVEGTIQLGYPERAVVGIGVLLLLCTLLYVIPRTAPIGAVLLTGYLGGAVASQLRIGAPLFSTILFPVYFAILVWGGLYLRDNRVRALVSA